MAHVPENSQVCSVPRVARCTHFRHWNGTHQLATDTHEETGSRCAGLRWCRTHALISFAQKRLRFASHALSSRRFTGAIVTRLVLQPQSMTWFRLVSPFSRCTWPSPGTHYMHRLSGQNATRQDARPGGKPGLLKSCVWCIGGSVRISIKSGRLVPDEEVWCSALYIYSSAGFMWHLLLLVSALAQCVSCFVSSANWSGKYRGSVGKGLTTDDVLCCSPADGVAGSHQSAAATKVARLRSRTHPVATRDEVVQLRHSPPYFRLGLVYCRSERLSAPASTAARSCWCSTHHSVLACIALIQAKHRQRQVRPASASYKSTVNRICAVSDVVPIRGKGQQRAGTEETLNRLHIGKTLNPVGKSMLLPHLKSAAGW
jgi:hypothetical protein